MMPAYREAAGQRVAGPLAVQVMAEDPPFPMVRRVVLDDLTVAGHPVRRGQVVTANVVAAQHDPSQWLQGSESDAWRALLMWGRAAHRCQGEYLGEEQLRHGLSVLLLRYPELTVVARGERPWPAILPSLSSLRVRLARPAGAR
jgi:cytochrome P450